MSEKRITEIIADGLDAAVDGRGWGIEHTEASRVADAAPELLAALEQILACVDRPGGSIRTITPEAIIASRAAIAKAKGE